MNAATEARRRSVRYAIGRSVVHALDEIAKDRRNGETGWALFNIGALIYFSIVAVGLVSLVAVGAVALVLNGQWFWLAVLASPFALGWGLWLMTDPERES